MDQDRRRHLRKAPESFAFVQIEGEEVGKVLNVSEGGLSFRSFAPVPLYGPLYFWFSFDLKDRIEGMGEVAWTDPSRKVGGLRFVQLSKSSREQVHTWISRLPVQASGDGPPPRLVPKVLPGRTGATEPDRVARFVAKGRFHFPPVAVEEAEPGSEDLFSPALTRSPSQDAGLFLEPEDRGQGHNFSQPVAPSRWPYASPSLKIEDRTNADIPANVEAEPRSPYASLYLNDGDSRNPSPFSPAARMPSPVELVSFERHLSVKKRQLVRGVLLGVCLSAAVAVGAVKYSNYRHRPAAATTVASAEPLVSKADAEALPPAPPLASPVSPAADIFSSGRPNKGILPKSPDSKPLAASYPYSHSQSQQRTAEAGAPNQARAAGSPRVSDPYGAARKKSMTPAQLWGAVQTGNTKAAVVLAEDYIQGDGVPKNCQQARVLLLIASEKRNAAAIKRLHELDQDKDTCP